MVLELAGGKRNGVEFAVLVHLGQDGPQASGRLGGAGGGIGDQSVLRSNLGNAMTGSEMSCLLRVLKAALASSGSGPPL